VPDTASDPSAIAIATSNAADGRRASSAIVDRRHRCRGVLRSADAGGAPRVAHGYSGGDCERARRTSLRETCSILGLVTSLGRDASESPDRAIRAIPIAKGYAEHGFGG